MTISVPKVGTPLAKTIHTDGSCSYKTRIGGWAWVCLADDTHACGGALDTTNQRMEMSAAFDAVKSNEGPLIIVSDSRYVVDTFQRGWYYKWKANGWKNYKKQPVANRDLWEPFIDLVVGRHEIAFLWVKGHSGDDGNEKADQLASWAAAQMP